MISAEKEKICDHAAILNTLYAKGVIILLTCGLRRGELLGLRWQDVDLTEGLIHVRHTMGRLKKFNVELSPYPYIRLDDYAPQSNHTALYLGPSKQRSPHGRSTCRHGPCRHLWRSNPLHSNYPTARPSSIRSTWCFARKRATPMSQKHWRRAFKIF